LSFLFALVGWRTGRKTGIFFTVYLLLMMIGSVHLGWHYAVDGYFSILSTGAIWWATGLWQKRWRPQGESLPIGGLSSE
ncbi:MAG TPA: phosphatase PAP2 family protein, partial [Micavibrio sp.]